MRIAKGSIVDIDGIQGALAEDISIQLKSNFRPLMSDFQNEITQLVDLAGATVRSLSGGRFGFSSQIKQFSAQVWDKTEPMRFQLNVEFHRVPLHKNTYTQNISSVHVMNVVKRFCSIPLPAELPGGMLIPPGPSPIEGIGLDAIMGGDRGVDVQGYVNLTIGSMRFRRILMESAEPFFSKFVDESGYPISCRVAFSFISLWAATKRMIEEW